MAVAVTIVFSSGNIMMSHREFISHFLWGIVFFSAIPPLHHLNAQDLQTEQLGWSDTRPDTETYVEVDGRFMVPYLLKIPGTDVAIQMIPVPGGVFEMGSEEEDESPSIQVKVEPMWVAKTETSWREYRVYMSMYQLFNSYSRKGIRQVTADNEIDAVTAPTELYDPTFTYEFGQEPDLPAVTMTQYAAKQYTKWLSKLTGRQYRLPTEAEWEYACRAGSTSAYCFGDDEDQLDQYAWYADNSDDQPHPIGQKKPNAFGLHDMHGNVMEWTIDEYTEDGYESLADKSSPLNSLEAVRWPTQMDQRVLRGGSWQDFADRCRSSSRMGSGEEADWKEADPNLPLSPWWYTDDPTRGIGFRIFRSHRPLGKDDIAKFWEIDHQYLQEDVASRLREGRGIQSAVDPQIAEDIRLSRE